MSFWIFFWEPPSIYIYIYPPPTQKKNGDKKNLCTLFELVFFAKSVVFLSGKPRCLWCRKATDSKEGLDRPGRFFGFDKFACKKLERSVCKMVRGEVVSFSILDENLAEDLPESWRSFIHMSLPPQQETWAMSESNLFLLKQENDLHICWIGPGWGSQVQWT